MKIVKRLVSVGLLCLLMLAPAATAYATVLDIDVDYVTQYGDPRPIPLTYDVVNVIGHLGDEYGKLNGPSDLFFGKDGFLYVADTGNHRIIKMTPQGEVVRAYTGPEDRPIKEPRGLYVDDWGDLYIADTGNQRVLHLSPEGEFVEQFVKPETDMLPSDFAFNPSKVAVDHTGNILMIKGHSFFMMNAENEFKGFVGANEVGFDLIRTLVRIFASKEQKARLSRAEPPPYTNFLVGDDGFIYATTDIVDSPIRRINAIGKNTYEDQLYYLSRIFYDTIVEKDSMPYFCDLAVDKNGIISTLELTTNTVFQFDDAGNQLLAFGGTGDIKGTFRQVASIVVDPEGRLYVLDSYVGSIQVFAPTRITQTIHSAIAAHDAGDYEASLALWNEVSTTNSNYALADRRIGDIYVKQERWKEAMAQYRLSDDPDKYSIAFAGYLNQTIRDYFAYVVLGLFAISALLVILISRGARYTRRLVGPTQERRLNPLQRALVILYHPRDAFYDIKVGRSRLGIGIPIILFVLTIAMRMLHLEFLHYPLATMDDASINISLEAFSLLLPLGTWLISAYFITTINDGESSFMELLNSGAYCLMPYIVLTVPMALLSNLLTLNEALLFDTIATFIWIWVYALLFYSLLEHNEYGFWKTVAICLVSIIFMLVIWAVTLLLLMLVSQVITFFESIFIELSVLLSRG